MPLRLWSLLKQSFVSFQIFSDLHLEVGQQYASYEIPVCADYLVLADKARQLEQEPSLNRRLIVFHQKRFDVPGCDITILGCTLWSKVPSELTDIVQSKVKDFQKIEGWSINGHNASHESYLAWLLKDMQTRREKQSVLVVTHHAPSLQRTSSPQHAKNPWSVAFGTDVLSQFADGVKESGVRVVSNQRGYVLPWSNSEAKDRFDVRKVIHVP
ncbi:uncharacterized protein BO97DRAFT_458460 [Aspergillus homomorphus CBS 101889]|uniref:Calcineurin-like phosphoesterase domain-containing protein n=1 Tax=Aspergillus homomorphus (strain CBS 101889) TaxID=1450537 RepID=A0A395HMX3_ASPHC|nr:hypothetical protein BO97DRAFT_458460 [Aspergillus homomorphus CBS 101889]RAL09282.1 hypothetical protein BO97DRAFT_458460 [Aspergillus homomorphus CBS 101889]